MTSASSLSLIRSYEGRTFAHRISSWLNQQYLNHCLTCGNYVSYWVYHFSYLPAVINFILICKKKLSQLFVITPSRVESSQQSVNTIWNSNDFYFRTFNNCLSVFQWQWQDFLHWRIIISSISRHIQPHSMEPLTYGRKSFSRRTKFQSVSSTLFPYRPIA